MSYVVYIHENLSNGKVYIGITGQKPERRWDNGRGYINNKYFSRAIEKYGWHNFDHRILYSGLSLEQANAIERELIKEYDSTNPEKGYNISLGGDGAGKFSELSRKKMSQSHKGLTPWNKGIPNSHETRQKIREALTGKKLSESTRKKMSASRIGEKNSFFGKHHTEETIHNMALNQPSRTVIVCLETGEIYESQAEAARQTGINQGNISLSCKGRGRAGGFHWMIVAEEE